MALKRKGMASDVISMFNAMFGYPSELPKSSGTIVHRINDKPTQKTAQAAKAHSQNYKTLILDFISRNPRCSAKQISSTLTIPHASVQAILTKAAIAGFVMRSALHEQRGCRPIYIYWIQE